MKVDKTSYEPSYPSRFGLNSTTIIFLKGWLWHEG